MTSMRQPPMRILALMSSREPLLDNIPHQLLQAMQRTALDFTGPEFVALRDRSQRIGRTA